jgi:hypothetical protein
VNQSTKRKTAKILPFSLKTCLAFADFAAERPGANLDAALLYRERETVEVSGRSKTAVVS